MNTYRGDSPAAMRTRMLWDLIPDAKVPEWSVALGVIPANNEGQQMEQWAAKQRRIALAPIIEEITQASVIAGDLVSKSKMLATSERNGGSTLEALDYTPQVMAGVIAVIANLVDLGALHVGSGRKGDSA